MEHNSRGSQKKILSVIKRQKQKRDYNLLNKVRRNLFKEQSSVQEKANKEKDFKPLTPYHSQYHWLKPQITLKQSITTEEMITESIEEAPKVEVKEENDLMEIE